MREAQSSVDKELADARQNVDEAMADPNPAGDANSYPGAQAPAANAESAPETVGALNGKTPSADASTVAANEAVDAVAALPPEGAGRATEKSGA